MALILSMTLFALVGAITPGPVNIIATGAGANFGFLRALPHVFGATVSYTGMVFLVGMGLNRVLLSYPLITELLQYAGGAYLLYMSFKIVTAKPMSLEAAQTALPPTVLDGALVQCLNPKAWLVSMSGVSLFVSTQTSAMLYLFVFCTVSFFMCFFGVGTWAAMGHAIHSLLNNARLQVAFNVCMGLILCSSVMTIFVRQAV